MSNLLINNFRLSFIWVEAFPNLLENNSFNKQPFACIGNEDQYKSLFDEIKAGNNTTLKLPWLSELNQPNYFWAYYLMDKDENEREPIVLDDVKKTRAWKQLMPFRSKQGIPNVKIPFLEEKKGYVSLEAFYYPHGLALVVSTGCKIRLCPTEAVEIAFAIRNDDIFCVQGNKINLNKLAQICLNTLRRENLGLNEFPERRVSKQKPFTIFTIVQAEGIDPTDAITENGEIHRMLEAVTVWHKPQNNHFSLTSLDQACIQFNSDCFPYFSSDKLKHLLYHSKRGRAVWFPNAFNDINIERHTLNCYHKNIVAATLQVESLCALVSLAVRDIHNDESLVWDYETRVKRAVGILRRLYGCANTYKSPSIPVQIEENDYVADIEEITDKKLNYKKEDVHLTRGKC